jgi:hypothetical protein
MGLDTFVNAADEDGGVADRKKLTAIKKTAVDKFLKQKGRRGTADEAVNND